MKQTSNNCCRK